MFIQQCITSGSSQKKPFCTNFAIFECRKLLGLTDFVGNEMTPMTELMEPESVKTHVKDSF